MHMLLHLVCRFLLWKNPNVCMADGLWDWKSENFFLREIIIIIIEWCGSTEHMNCCCQRIFYKKKQKTLPFRIKPRERKKKPPIHWKENVNWTVIVKHWTVTMEHWTNIECMLHTATVINQSAHYPVDKWAIKYTLPNHNSTSFLVFVFHFP